jgi:hypothetical protein
MMMIINPDASIVETAVMLASFAEAALLSFGLLLFYRRGRRRQHTPAQRPSLEVIGEKDAKPPSSRFHAAAWP